MTFVFLRKFDCRIHADHMQSRSRTMRPCDLHARFSSTPMKNQRLLSTWPLTASRGNFPARPPPSLLHMPAPRAPSRFPDVDKDRLRGPSRGLRSGHPRRRRHKEHLRTPLGGRARLRALGVPPVGSGPYSLARPTAPCGLCSGTPLLTRTFAVSADAALSGWGLGLQSDA